MTETSWLVNRGEASDCSIPRVIPLLMHKVAARRTDRTQLLSCSEVRIRGGEPRERSDVVRAKPLQDIGGERKQVRPARH